MRNVIGAVNKDPATIFFCSYFSTIVILIPKYMWTKCSLQSLNLYSFSLEA